MKSTKDTVIGKKFVAAFVSPNGFGKTVAVASFHERYKKRNQKIVIMDFDGRIDPVKLVYPEADNIFYETYGPGNFMNWIADYAKFLADPLIGLLVCDSFTSLSMTSVLFQMEAKGAQNKLTKGGLAVPTWDEINGETNIISAFQDKCKEYAERGNKDIIFCYHPVDKTVIIEGGGSYKTQSVAAYGNKLPSITLNYFNEVYSFDLEAPIESGKPRRRVIYTQPTGTFLGKSALGLPPKLDITDKGLYKTISDELKKRGIDF